MQSVFRSSACLCGSLGSAIKHRYFSASNLARYPRRRPTESRIIPESAIPDDATDARLAQPSDWYMDTEFVPSRLRSLPPTKKPSDAPSDHMPSQVRSFMGTLQESPFFAQVKVIDAKALSDGSHYTDWIFICILKEGRQRSIRGATMRTRDELVEMLHQNNSSGNVIVEGHDTDGAMWTLVDAANASPGLIVHVMTPQAHGQWNLEGMWLDSRPAADDQSDQH